jgi:hypothetical protein
MHIDLQLLIALGVGTHLLAALAKTLWKTPQHQAQVDAIERKVDAVLGALQSGTTPSSGK